MKKLRIPHTIKRISIGAIFLMLLWMPSQAQTQSTYSSTDSTTYAQYMTGDWDALIQSGQRAVSSGIDYFYLRMRIAYAYYSKGQYRLAIPHYIKALNFNANDANAQYFLMQCYAYAGRANDALKFSSKISGQKLPDLKAKYQQSVLAGGIIYSYSGSNNDVDFTHNSNANLSIDAIQKTTNYFHNTHSFLSHRMGKSVIVNHSLDYLYKNEYNYIINGGTPYVLNDQALHQWTYGLNMQITPFTGFTVTPGFHHIKIYIPTTYKNLKFNTSLYSLKAQYELNKVSLGTSSLVGTLNDVKNIQIGGHFTWYPKANLNLYYSLDTYWQQQQVTKHQNIDIIVKNTIGFKISNYWWAEASVILPEYNNFYDFSTGALYNSLESNKNTFSINNIFLTKNDKLSFTLGVTSNTNVSYLVQTEDPLNKTNGISYNTLTFTGGLIWKL
ncbi:tetratricopeptide repeat protein [Labilibacter marinus]|uniref:tetratricopeptide repeat protein n=1 Tax=Labilibacter marinus TaxID=1477105 RepID=UPI00095006E5|nr:hypothetical protein [Labilibacter marinus]